MECGHSSDFVLASTCSPRLPVFLGFPYSYRWVGDPRTEEGEIDNGPQRKKKKNKVPEEKKVSKKRKCPRSQKVSKEVKQCKWTYRKEQ